jgi:hypothetical protein
VLDVIPLPEYLLAQPNQHRDVALLGLLELEAPQQGLGSVSAVLEDRGEERVLLAPVHSPHGYAEKRSNLFVGAVENRQLLEVIEVDRLCGARH